MPHAPVPHITDTTPRSSYLGAFYMYPPVTFDSQEADETIVLLVRAHPITFLPWIATALFFAVLPLIINVFIAPYFTITEIIFMNMFWYILILSFVFMNVLYWLFNVGLITKKRIVDVDYSLVIYREVTETSLEDVTDATAKVAGFIGSLFRFGNVFVQTPGSNQNIEFLNAPEPDHVVAVINQLTD